MASNTSNSAGLVFVGCKLPSGLYMDHRNVDAMPGVPPAEGERFLLKGTNSVTTSAGQHLPDSGGYGITAVPADFFADWMARHKDFPPVRNGLIFAIANEADARKEAKARGEVLSGFEGLDPEKPGPGLQKADKGT